MNKYTFLANSTTGNLFLTSIWYQNIFLILKSKMAGKFGYNFFQAKQNLIPLQSGMNATVNMTIAECLALNDNHKLQ